MNNFFRAIIAGYGAKKLGGGCFGTIIVFILIWVALGQCSFSSREVPAPETYPVKARVCVPVVLPGWDKLCATNNIAPKAARSFNQEVVAASISLKAELSLC